MSQLLIMIFGLLATQTQNFSALENDTWTGKWFPNVPSEGDQGSNTLASPEDKWKGNWFPHPPFQNINDTHIILPGRSMSITPTSCDNAKDGLSIDFDPRNITQQTVYMCLQNRSEFQPNVNLEPILREYVKPPAYSAIHKCMNETISYTVPIPTFGPHRTLWPKYGEYTYIPPQRWIHSLEHGSIVALFHPCANGQEITKLKKLVKQCLYRHIISPSSTLSTERPFALVAWGKSLEMSFIDLKIAIAFIRMNALQGPEKIDTDGSYIELLTDAAVAVSPNDSALCPNM